MAPLCLETWSTSKDSVFAVPIESLIESMRVALTVFVTLVHRFKRLTFRIILCLQLLKLSIISLKLKQMRRALKHKIKLLFMIQLRREHLPCFIERNHA